MGRSENICFPFRRYLLNCVRESNDIPKAFRWLYKDHAPAALAALEPICRKYAVYHLLPYPESAVRFGAYNWVLREQSLLVDPELFEQGNDHATALKEYRPDDFCEITNQPLDWEAGPWQGSAEGYHPTVRFSAPVFWEKDLKGRELTLLDGANLRWLLVLRYPENVEPAEGDRWFFEQFAPVVTADSGVRRFITSAALDKPGERWHRVAEIWFKDYESWENLMVGKAGQFPAPDWAEQETLPFLKPYENFVSAFLLDRPDADLMTQYRGYIATR